MHDNMLKNNYIDHRLQVGDLQWYDIWEEMQPITFTRCPRIIQFE